jgi:hypothetical protein
MTLRLALSSLLLGLLLAACAQPPAAPPAPATPATCQAEPARFAVGQLLSRELIEDARRRSGAARARALRPGQVVTMEFDGTRLNLVVDGNERVTAVRCG